jgi:hypothetical protein
MYTKRGILSSVFNNIALVALVGELKNQTQLRRSQYGQV